MQQTQQNEQLTTIRSQVAQKFNADEATIDDFMETMSKPESLTVENLWKLYSLQKAESGSAVPQSNQNIQPSATFEQTRRAQQIPSPMGVVTGVNQGSDGRDPEDKMMDSMVADYKGRNPF